MKVLGVADFSVDAIFKNEKFLKYDGGQSAFNVLYNLKKFYDYDVYAYGNVSRDNLTKKCVELMKEQGINTDFLVKKYKKPRIFHYKIVSLNGRTLRTLYSKKCFNCGTNYFSKYKRLSFNTQYLNQGYDIAVFDKPTKDRLRIAKYLRKKGTTCFLDIGYNTYFRKKSPEKILEMLKEFEFDFIQVNGKVADYLVNKLGLKDNYILYRLFNCKFMSVTYGENGTKIIWKNPQNSMCNMKSVEFKIDNVMDGTGAGDAFLASTIKTFVDIGTDFEEYKKVLKDNAYKIVKATLSEYGSRFESIGVVEDYRVGRCSRCGGKEVRRTKLQSNIDIIVDRVEDAYEVDFENKLKAFTDKAKSLLVVGTGASYTTANYIKDVLLRAGKFACSIKPCDMVDVNLNNFDSVILCSYGGETPEIKDCMSALLDKEINIALLTGKDESEFNNLPPKVELLSYASTVLPRERGFIAVSSIIVPAYFITKIYSSFDIEKVFTDFVLRLEKEVYKLKVLRDESHLVDIFYNGEIETVAKDLESKFTESSFGRVLLHNKKDFSHGRYTAFEKFRSDLVVYYDYNKGNKYEAMLLDYIKRHGTRNVLVLNATSEDKEIKEFELLLINQYLINYLDHVVYYDFSNPHRSEAATKLYKYRR